MFSWILEFISVVKAVEKKIQDEKTKRIKRRTKDEALKESDSITEAHEKTKNSENVVEAEKKSKKLKGQKILIDVLKFVAELFEVSIIGTLIFIGILIFFVALVVILIMFILYGFLTNTGIIPDGGIFSPSQEDCIQGTQAMANSGFDFSAIGQLAGTLTPYEQNLYKTMGLYLEVINQGETAIVNPDKFLEVRDALGPELIATFLFGFSATETGLEFNNGGSAKGERDILLYPSQQKQNNALGPGLGYAFLGLCNRNVFDGTYKYNGSDSTTCLTSEFVNSWKAKYQPAETPIYDNNYVPYGVATQTGQFFHNTSSGNYQAKEESVDSCIDSIMDEYGIVANRETLAYFCKLFAGAGYYHSDHGSVNSNLYSLWCALWSATSTDDSQRSFNNIKIVYDKNYTESSARPYVVGLYGKYNLTYITGQNMPGYFEINGESISTTLWEWVSNNCSNKDYFNKTAQYWINSYSGDEHILNGHYGLVAYLMGCKVLGDLGGTIPLATGGSIDNCDCYEGGSVGGTVNVGNRDFSNVKHGEIQGEYPENIKNKMLNNRTFSQHFGKLNSIDNPNSILSGNVTYEQWRLSSKWQVPYQHQSSKIETWAKYVDFDGVTMADNCPLMTQAYIFSAMTGKAINVAEITALGAAHGGWSRRWAQICIAAGDYGFYMRTITFNSTTNRFSTVCVTDDAETNAPIIFPEKQGHKDVIEMINYVLDNNGIVGVNTRGAKHDYRGRPDGWRLICGANKPYSKFANSNHYFVITHRVGDTYYTHSASHPDLDIVGHKIEDIIGTEGNALCTCWSCNLIFAYNPSLTVVDNTQASGTQTGGTQTGGTQTGGTQTGGTQTTNVSAFENFLFIGDSFTVNLDVSQNLATKGHIVKAVGSAKPGEFKGITSGPVKVQGKTVSLEDVKDIKGIMFLLGVNGAPTATGDVTSGHIDNIKSVLQELDAKYDVPIYVQKVFPVGSGYLYKGTYNITADIYNKAIEKINTEIEAFCNSSNSFTFIDTTSGLVENGYLKYVDGENLHIAGTGDINGVKTNLYEYWYSNIEKAVLSGGSNSTSTNSSSVNCISSSNSGVSASGAIDLDLDVDDYTEKIKAGSWGHSYSKTRTKDEIKFIVVHFWGSQSKNSGDAQGLIHGYETGGMNREDGKTYMAQYVVDKDGIYRTAPDLVNVQHSGGGLDKTKGSGYVYNNALKPLGMERCTSNNSIGIEASNSDLNNTAATDNPNANVTKGFYVYEKGTIENLISLTKALMIEYNIDVDHIYRHYDCTMKTCPAPFIDDQYLWPSSASEYDKGESQNWKAFKECLTSDTIDWSKFNDHVVDNIK